MEIFGSKIEQNEQLMSNAFICKNCDYTTSRKLNYERHLKSIKHKRGKMGQNNEQIEQSVGFTCLCGKTYVYNKGLTRHMQTCSKSNTNIITKEQITPELILQVIQQNKELTNIIHKLCDNNSIHTNNTTNTLINNSNNNTFNLQVYLNETCKNAINIDEFVDNIKLSLDDLEYTGRKGYIEGISNIILKNLNRLSEYDRPLHCSDNKREVLYIKRNNVWNKEERDKPILTNAIKNIANQNIKQIAKWREENPDCTKADSKKNNLYLKIVSNSMCGIDKEETTKNINKIVSNVIKEVAITKNSVL